MPFLYVFFFIVRRLKCGVCYKKLFAAEFCYEICIDIKYLLKLLSALAFVIRLVPSEFLMSVTLANRRTLQHSEKKTYIYESLACIKTNPHTQVN